jgi:transcription termination/antitermination protein NusA
MFDFLLLAISGIAFILTFTFFTILNYRKYISHKETLFDDIRSAEKDFYDDLKGMDLDELVQTEAGKELLPLISNSTYYTEEESGLIEKLSELGKVSTESCQEMKSDNLTELAETIYDEYVDKEGTIVSGIVLRFEGSIIILNLGKAEGYLPKPKQVINEHLRVGESVRCLVTKVRKDDHGVKILLSRNHADFVRQLFALEVPEILEKSIVIKRLVRESGYRTKIAVYSEDPNVDSVGACVGVRGTRIKNIVDELNGEKIDIIRWNKDQGFLIPNALTPAQITGILLYPENQAATVIVPDDQLSLAIGKKGYNVRLASELVGWDIDIITDIEQEQELKRKRKASGRSVEKNLDEAISSDASATGKDVEDATLSEYGDSEEVQVKVTKKKTSRKTSAIISRQKVVWKIFDASYKEIDCFTYSQKDEAFAKMNDLNQKKTNDRYFINEVKIPIEDE